MCGSRPKLVTGLGLHADNEEGEQRRLLVAGASAGTEALQLGAAVLSDGRAARCDHAAIARRCDKHLSAIARDCVEGEVAEVRHGFGQLIRSW